MTTEAAQLQFAAEFTLFIAAVAIVVVTALRHDAIVVRPVLRGFLVAGAMSLATAAFLHGSLLVDDTTAGVLVTLRLVGVGLLASTVSAWPQVAFARGALGWGLLGLLGAEVASAVDRPGLSDGIRGLGAFVVFAAVFAASRRWIASRIAAAAGLVTLIVITTLSIAVSQVIASSVDDEVSRRYQARAETEVGRFTVAAGAATDDALVLANLLGRRDAVIRSSGSEDPRTASAASAQIDSDIAAFVDELKLLRVEHPGPLAVFRVDGGTPEPVSIRGATDLVRTELVGADVLRQVFDSGTSANRVSVVGNAALAIGAAPIRSSLNGDLIGIAMVTARLDHEYLDDRVSDPSSTGEGIGLALASRTTVFGRAGVVTSQANLLGMTSDSVVDQEPRVLVDGERFVVAYPVPVIGDPPPIGAVAPSMAVLVSVPKASIDATRQDLLRTVFLVALGGALAAMLLAGLAGSRIGTGLRHLASAATDLEGGDFSARARVESDDELGSLGESFNHMAFALESMTGELRSSVEAETALRSRLQGVLGGMGEALIAVDDHGRVSDFNRAAEELIGVPAREVLGRPLSDHCTVRGDGGTDLTRRLVEPVIDSWTSPAEIVRAQGAVVPVAISAAALRDVNGVLAGAVFVMRDTRREREIDRMKTEFVANISHELRTPLTTVQGYADLLATKELDQQRTRQFAQQIAQGARQLHRVTEQLVQVAAMAAGRLELELSDQRPRAVLDDVVERWADRAGERHELVRRVARSTPDLRVDRRHLDLALDELVDNALKYSPEGGRVQMTAAPAELDGTPHVRFSVTDEGIGIDADQREGIFEEFAQGDGSATRNFGGLGLGLATVQRIVRAHGGLLVCDSEEGKGTTMSIVLPVHQQAQVEPDFPGGDHR